MSNTEATSTAKDMSIYEFEKIVMNIVDNCKRLKEYDYFGANAIISVIQLMLSKSDLFVRQCEQDANAVQQNSPYIPKDVEEEVDDIISRLKDRLSK